MTGPGIVHVLHPAPVRMVLHGGRRERLRFEAIRTPVRPVRLGGSEMRQIDGPPRPANGVASAPPGSCIDTPLWEAEGRLWMRAMAGHGPQARPLREERFLAEIESRSNPKRWSVLDRCLIGTPLRAWHRDPRDTKAPPDGLRMGQAELPSGVVVESLRERSSDAVSTFFRDGIRIVDGIVHHAFEGFHLAVLPPERPGSPGMGRLTAVPRNFLLRTSHASLLLRADRGYEGRIPDSDHFALMSSRVDEDTDILLLANEFPSRVIKLIESVGRCLRHIDLDPLRHWAALGSIGAVDAHGAREVMRLCYDTATRATPLVLRDEWARLGLQGVADLARDWALPILAGDTALDLGDEEALAGL